MFPFKLATTSYIFPDHIVPNVASLAPFFDEIELVLFESADENNFPDKKQIEVLMDLSFHYGVNFNIHLPIDIFLGDKNEEVRSKGISIVRKVIERTRCLHPSVYILHFDRRNIKDQDEIDIKTWKSLIIRSAEEILENGMEPNRISIETLSYPFEWIEDIIKKFGFSICLDIGHIMISGQNLQLYLERYLSEVSIIHLHGFKNGTDHLGIEQLPDPALQSILSYLRNYHGIVSIEVFSIDDLKSSLAILEEKWAKR